VADVTVVGVFPHDDAARGALRQLDEAGFPADRVGVVAGNVRQAREVAGSFSPRAAMIGAVIGALVGLGLGVASGMSVNNVVATPLGMLMLAIVGAFIGGLAGRGKALKSHEYEKYQRVVDKGDALVTIRCAAGEQERARTALTGAGATAVRVEGTAETV